MTDSSSVLTKILEPLLSIATRPFRHRGSSVYGSTIGYFSIAGLFPGRIMTEKREFPRPILVGKLFSLSKQNFPMCLWRFAMDKLRCPAWRDELLHNIMVDGYTAGLMETCRLIETPEFHGRFGIVHFHYMFDNVHDRRHEAGLRNITFSKVLSMLDRHPCPGTAHVMLLDFDGSDAWVQQLRELPIMPEGVNLVLVGYNEHGHIVTSRRIDEEAFTNGHMSPDELAVYNELVELREERKTLEKRLGEIDARTSELCDVSVDPHLSQGCVKSTPSCD